MNKKLIWLFAVLLTTGVSTASADSVGVSIDGEISNAAAVGCRVTTGALNFNYQGDSDDWAPYTGGSAEGEFRFDVVATDEIGIDCSTAETDTFIKFSTNDTDSQNPLGGCGDNSCTSYPVVFQPDPASCLSQETSCEDNLGEGRVTVNLTAVDCGGAACSSQTTGVFSVAEIKAPAVAGILAAFSGTLIAGGQPRGELSVSPRTQGPQLYVIYGEE
jgi:hypothetical protein